MAATGPPGLHRRRRSRACRSRWDAAIMMGPRLGDPLQTTFLALGAYKKNVRPGRGSGAPPCYLSPYAPFLVPLPSPPLSPRLLFQACSCVNLSQETGGFVICALPLLRAPCLRCSGPLRADQALGAGTETRRAEAPAFIQSTDSVEPNPGLRRDL